LQLTTPQQTILDSPARFKVVAAGRRMGKTFASIASLAKHARFPNSKCMYVSPSYRMSKQIVWEDLKEMLRQARWLAKANESELTCTLVNGSIIMLRSADNYDSIRGIGVDHVILDEAADLSEEAWTSVIRPCLSDREGSALIIGSPKGRNWFYDLYENAKNLKDWQSWSFTTAEGGNVTQEEVEAAKQDMDERTFQQEYMAQFVTYSGVIYYAFGNHNISPMGYQPSPGCNLHVGIDFNVDPGAAVIGYKTQNHMHIIDEVEIYGTNTQEMVTEIQQRWSGHRFHAYPDASGAQRRTSAGGVTDHIILKNAGFKLNVGSVNPSVKDRIGAVNSALKSVNGDIKLTIDPKCSKLINALRKQTYKEGTRQPDKDSGLDHFVDALGYLVNHMYPVKVEYKKFHGKVHRG
jgi:hypothetical protein